MNTKRGFSWLLLHYGALVHIAIVDAVMFTCKALAAACIPGAVWAWLLSGFIDPRYTFMAMFVTALFALRARNGRLN